MPVPGAHVPSPPVVNTTPPKPFSYTHLPLPNRIHTYTSALSFFFFFVSIPLLFFSALVPPPFFLVLKSPPPVFWCCSSHPSFFFSSSCSFLGFSTVQLFLICFVAIFFLDPFPPLLTSCHYLTLITTLLPPLCRLNTSSFSYLTLSSLS